MGVSVKHGWMAWEVWAEQQKCDQHPAFPGGPPPQYYPGLKQLNFGVRMGIRCVLLSMADRNAVQPHTPYGPQAHLHTYPTLHTPMQERSKHDA